MTDDTTPEFTPFKEEEEEEAAPITVEEQEVLQEIGISPTTEEDGLRQQTINYERMFNEIFLEVYDIESALNRASEKYTEALLKRGIQVNPTNVYSQVELMSTRLIKVNIIKRLCNVFGLHAEMDSILEKELSMIYSPSRTPEKDRRIIRTAVGESSDRTN